MSQPLDATPDSFAERLFLSVLRYAIRDRRALRAYLRARQLLGLALGQELIRLRSSGDPLAAVLARAASTDILVHNLRRIADLLRSRLDKLPSRRRPHYTPAQRFEILEIQHLLGLTQKQTAHLFCQAEGTIAQWTANANPTSRTVGATLRPTPPIRRYNDTVHHLTQTLARFGIGEPTAIVQHLARAGWIIARSTAQRYLRGPRIPDPNPPQTPRRAIRARHPHHIWHLDLTQLPAFARAAAFHLAVMLDSFSRMPLCFQILHKAATAPEMAAFLDRTAAALGRPKYIVVDRGGEFTGDAFRDMAYAHRLKPRYASSDNHRANSRIERFWRSLKALLQFVPSRLLSPEDAERDVERALRYYAYHRPHQGLGGATPAEVYFGLTPAHADAVQPPRGRRGDPPVPLPATVEILDGDPRFPYLKRVA